MRAIFFVGLTVLSLVSLFMPSMAAPALEEYIKEAGEGAKAIAAGQLKLDGHRAICGRRPTALNPQFDDYGGAFPNANPGYIILNPKKLKGLSTSIKFYIYSHECGHQMRGASESGADCFAVKRGRRYGWLNRDGLDEICKFMWDHKADFTHAAGPERCEAMKICFEAAAPKAKKK